MSWGKRKSRSYIPRCCDFDTCVRFGSIFFLSVDCLASMNTCSFSLQCIDRMGTRESKWRQNAPCTQERGQHEGLGLKLLLNRAEGNTRDKNCAHRHEKSLRAGAVLDSLVWGYFKRWSIWGNLVFFLLPFCYSESCLDTGKAELMRHILNVPWFVVGLSCSETGLLDD